MNENERQRLNIQYSLAFLKTDQFILESERGAEVWLKTQVLQSQLAGPLSAIIDKGNCGYVYDRSDAYFRDVVDPSTLRGRLLDWHAQLLQIVDNFEPTTQAEHNDLETINKRAFEMMKAIRMACDVEDRRCKNESSAKI